MHHTQEEARKKSELLKNKLLFNELGSEAPLEEFSPDKLILPYGIGIDTHSRFIQVCVLIRSANSVLRSEYEFQCLWPELLKCREILDALLSKHIPDYSPIKMHYCIESTSVYHYPIVLALEGDAHIVNPTLAGNSRKKTDVLDARMLAYQSMSSMWKLSFFPSADVFAHGLRVIDSWKGLSFHLEPQVMSLFSIPLVYRNRVKLTRRTFQEDGGNF